LTGMKFQVDANLSRQIAEALAAAGYETSHVRGMAC